MDMINPDERVDYNLYLKQTERTISEKLGCAINIFGSSRASDIKFSNLSQAQQAQIP
jgi:hypothetical protein